MSYWTEENAGFREGPEGKGTFVSGNGRRASKRWPGAICHAVCIIWLTCILYVGLGQFSTAEAQTASFRLVDTNADGVLSIDEFVAAFGTAGARKLLQDIDRNGDNRIPNIEPRGGRNNGKGRQKRPKRG
ncbi:hypothetical protein [Ruegeria sp. MALMAid1280]|uniref:hypothetical protein n=1 Tax=Ruegeria sp. MALMAid1280 TaxID=3411634 RepID=UPI003BA0A990